MNGADMKIGLLLPSWTGAMDGITPTAAQVINIAQLAEQVGFDTLWVSDHFYFEPYVDFRVVGVEFPDDYAGVKGGQWECWALMSALAVATKRAGSALWFQTRVTATQRCSRVWWTRWTI